MNKEIHVYINHKLREILCFILTCFDANILDYGIWFGKGLNTEELNEFLWLFFPDESLFNKQKRSPMFMDLYLILLDSEEYTLTPILNYVLFHIIQIYKAYCLENGKETREEVSGKYRDFFKKAIKKTYKDPVISEEKFNMLEDIAFWDQLLFIDTTFLKTRVICSSDKIYSFQQYPEWKDILGKLRP